MTQENVPSTPAPAAGTSLSLWQVINNKVKTRDVCWDAKFLTAQELWDACMAYFEHIENNPIEAKRLSTYEGQSSLSVEPRHRMPTLSGLVAWLGVHKETYRRWGVPGTNLYREDLAPVINAVSDIMYDWKFTAGAAGVANAGMMMRDLGLSDKVHLNQTAEEESEDDKPDDSRIANQMHPDATPDDLDTYYAVGKEPPMYSQEQLDAGADWIGPYRERK